MSLKMPQKRGCGLQSLQSGEGPGFPTALPLLAALALRKQRPALTLQGQAPGHLMEPGGAHCHMRPILGPQANPLPGTEEMTWALRRHRSCLWSRLIKARLCLSPPAGPLQVLFSLAKAVVTTSGSTCQRFLIISPRSAAEVPP